MDFLNNLNVKIFITIALALYSGLAAPALPDSVIQFFDTSIGKLLFIFLIGYVSSKNIEIALMVAIALVTTLNVLNKRQVENFVNREYFAVASEEVTPQEESDSSPTDVTSPETTDPSDPSVPPPETTDPSDPSVPPPETTDPSDPSISNDSTVTSDDLVNTPPTTPDNEPSVPAGSVDGDISMNETNAPVTDTFMVENFRSNDDSKRLYAPY